VLVPHTTYPYSTIGKLLKEAARTVQHMQKSMITMNVQLSNTISDLSGTTGLAIIRAILTGERNPEKAGETARLAD
jgi:hypothetical protein